MRLCLLVGVFGSLASLGCVSLPQAPVYPDGMSEQSFEEVPGEELTGLEEDPAQPLRLYPGDVVKVTTIGQETKEITDLVIDETGDVHLPLGGDVTIGGATLSEAEERLEDVLQAYIKFVRVNVTLTDPAGHRASVLGAVAEPGEVKVRPGMRLSDLLAAAEGPLMEVGDEGETQNAQVFADLKAARLHRDGEPLPVSIPRALEGDPRHDVRIRPGDHLYVPPKILDRVVVLGAVNGASAFNYRRGMLLTEALALAGGSTIEADRADIRIVRGGLSDPKVYTADLHDIVDGETHNVALQSGDIVFVTDHWIADFGEVLDRLGPLITAGLTIGLTTAIIATD